MITYSRNHHCATLRSTSYTYQVLKPNHYAWGNYAGECWITVHAGQRGSSYDEFLHDAVIYGAVLSGLSEPEFEYLCQLATEDNATLGLTIEGDVLRLHHFPVGGKSCSLEISAGAKQEKVRKFRAEVINAGLMPTPKQVQKINSRQVSRSRKTSPFAYRPTTGKARPSSEKTATKNEGDHARAVALQYQQEKLGIKPATPSAKPTSQPILSRKNQKFVNAGVMVADITSFRKWDKAHEYELYGIALSIRVDMFYNRRSIEPLGLIEKGLRADEIDSFLTMCQKSDRASLKGHNGFINVFFRNRSNKKPPGISEVQSTINITALPHDAHVIAFRRNRANILRQLRRVAVREGSSKFRAIVLANFGGVCCITGCSDHVEAAHIIPHADSANMHPANGLALTKFLHAAFDQYAFSVNPLTLAILVADSWRGILNIHGTSIAECRLVAIDRSALTYHFEAFMEHHRSQHPE
ncbi:TPA: HNH endonuclease [Kluyvera georgiana]|nr:HNH endonuclease [Kluyvera georgiana]